jgi:dihydrofolate synthase/folylpolyglutamate synthase
VHYDEAIGWLFSLTRFGMKLGLENMQALSEAIGRPQDHFQSVLVAGTNGKGSTSAILHAILLASGRRAGLYTSPHLVRTEERIRLDDRDIGADEITSLIAEVRARIERLLAKEQLAAHPTFFEVITCVALLAFVRAGVEIAVLEVGLGGRLDATNIADPILSIITNIDFDHQEHLGPTLASIAREKAGILRRGVPALVGDVGKEALGAIREEARARGARVILASDGSRIGAPRVLSPLTPPEFPITTPVREYASVPCPLPGEHQRANTLIAIRAAELLDAPERPITAQAVVKGIGGTRWPGRLEWVEGRPPLLLDGAHNPAGCRALADYLGTLGTKPILLFAAMRDKQVELMLETLLPRVAGAVFTRPPMARASEPAELLETARRIARALGLSAAPQLDVASLNHPEEERLAVRDTYAAEADVPGALAAARAQAGASGIVLVAGSLFLIGAVKEVLLGLPVRAGEA